MGARPIVSVAFRSLKTRKETCRSWLKGLGSESNDPLPYGKFIPRPGAVIGIPYRSKNLKLLCGGGRKARIEPLQFSSLS
jgi:hypothetical protein